MCTVSVLVGCSGGSGDGSSGSSGATDAGVACAAPADAGQDAGNPDAGALPSYPQVPANLGQVMNPLHLVTLVAANDTEGPTLDAFSDALASSSWWPAVGTEYGLATITNTDVTIPAIDSDVSESDLLAYVGQAIADGGAPAPDGNTLYLLYVPSSHGLSDTAACGYHITYPDDALTRGDAAAVVQQCQPYGGDSALDETTEVASHEIFEAATDPTLRSYNLGITGEEPWLQPVWMAFAQDGYIELADLCEGSRIREAGHAYQRIWSNRAALDGGDPCVPATGQPFFNLRSQQEWYAGQAGSTVTIPFEAYATGTVSEWIINWHELNVVGAFNDLTSTDVTLSSEDGNASFGRCDLVKPEVKDGSTGALQVNIPADARSGDYIVFDVHSYHYDAVTCDIPSDEDAYHSWVVGVYVP